MVSHLYVCYTGCVSYGVATISKLLKIIGLFCRIVSFIGLFCKRDLCFKGAYNRQREREKDTFRIIEEFFDPHVCARQI